MSWGGGSTVMEAVIKSAMSSVHQHETRKKLYEPIIEELENLDWDNLEEPVGLDKAYDELIDERFE